MSPNSFYETFNKAKPFFSLSKSKHFFLCLFDNFQLNVLQNDKIFHSHYNKTFIPLA